MNPATIKIISIIADIVTYEVKHSNDGYLLSEECDRWIEKHPIAARMVIVSAGTIVTLHLANLLDPSFDPMSKRVWKTIFERGPQLSKWMRSA